MASAEPLPVLVPEPRAAGGSLMCVLRAAVRACALVSVGLFAVATICWPEDHVLHASGSLMVSGAPASLDWHVLDERFAIVMNGDELRTRDRSTEVLLRRVRQALGTEPRGVVLSWAVGDPEVWDPIIAGCSITPHDGAAEAASRR